MKLPVISGKEAIKALSKQGFVITGQRGSHVHLEKNLPEKTLHVTVPIHGNEDLNPFVLRSIIRQAGSSPEEFSKYL